MKALIAYARRFIGVPYHYGGKSAAHKLDCSGLVQEILQFAGVDPSGDQNAQAYFNHFSKHGTVCQPQPGALVFYGSSTSDVSHISFCASVHTVVEAAGGDSTTKTDEIAEQKRAFVKERPLTRRNDIVAILMPQYPAWLTEVE